MLDALKTLFENDVVSEEVRAEIENAWDSKIKENRQQQLLNFAKNLLRNMSMINQLWLKLSML